jgi:acetolactate synthase-1/2/3 large subunit
MRTLIATEQRTAASEAGAMPIGARLLCQALQREGVDTIFGMPGGAVLPIYSALGQAGPALRHILVRHEQGAVHMAEGYARASGRTGVALVTSGPGATNAVTGIANAYMDSTPLVVITGQVPTKMLGSDAFQEIDIVGMTLSCTKYNYALRRAAEIPGVVREAFQLARSGRPGPVLIDMPKDVSSQPSGEESFAEAEIPGYQPALAPELALIEEAVERLCTARRPVLYVGGGVIHAGAERELLELAERLGLPVAVTLMGLGAFPTRHPLCLGMLGMHGNYWANLAVSEADLILSVGARFDDRVTGAVAKFAPAAQIVHIDVDASSIGKNVRTDLGIHADARSALREMLPLLPHETAGARRLAPWWQQIEQWKGEGPLRFEDSETAIKPQRLCRELDRLTAGQAIVVTDVGQHQMWLAQYYGFTGSRQSITSGGLGTMGFGLPAAIGAKIALPEGQVIAFVGDGGFQMTLQELATAVECGAAVKVIVMNTSCLGMVRQQQDLLFQRDYNAVDMTANPDFVKLAEAYGATGFRATRPAELGPVLQQALETPGVVVVDVRVTKEENVYPMVPPGAGLKEMLLG